MRKNGVSYTATAPGFPGGRSHIRAVLEDPRLSHVIEIENVHWRRNESDILRGIHWNVRAGEHWALLGLNGSGKTTLLNMVTGYVWPTEGRISVLGHRYGNVDLRELRKRIGWVSSAFQQRIAPHESGLDVVVSGHYASIGLFERPTTQLIRRAGRLMESLGCHHTAERPYGACSHGEKQKLLIARALMADPELLILDEPATGLDFVSRESLLESIRDLACRPDGPTLVYVTHHIEEIVPEFSHTLLLRDGAVAAQGPTADVLTDDVLSDAFGLPVHVRRQRERSWLILGHRSDDPVGTPLPRQTTYHNR